MSSRAQLFVDIEWEFAHHSMGAPISIGIVHQDGRGAYAEFRPANLVNPESSQWTTMRVVPRLKGGVAEPGGVPYYPLEKVLDLVSRHEGTVWVGETAAKEWLTMLGVTSFIFPGEVNEQEAAKLWWAKQEWANAHDGYHAWEDACGMRICALHMGRCG